MTYRPPGPDATLPPGKCTGAGGTRATAGILALAAACLAFVGCSRESQVDVGNQQQILNWGNLSEPTDLDPQIIDSNTDANIVYTLFEGLAAYDPKDLHAIPGVAESWESNADATVWTFHLRANAVWSNGDPVTAGDFVYSFHRMLSPKLAAEYASFLFHLKNGEAYFNGKVTDFGQVGAKAVDDRTLVLTLWHPLPYLPSLVCHSSWYPVHKPTIEKYGAMDDRATAWTKPGNIVGNGPYVLTEWRPNQVIRVVKSPTYWNHDAVKLAGCNFFPIEDEATEEASFRSGQLHVTANIPIDKIAGYRKDPSGVLRSSLLLATYFYRLNVNRPPLDNVKVRRALSLAVDRRQICEDVAKGGQVPAGSLVTPGTGGFVSTTSIKTDVPEAQRLLAEAGYPGGKGFPDVEILYNTTEGHRRIAEAIQQMWLKNLGINVTLQNQEAKVWNDTMRQHNYQIGRFAWVGDYLDPSTFIDIMTTHNGNNETGWSNAEYDRLDDLAMKTGDNAKRYEYFQQCEAILAKESPIIPIYFYVRNNLVRPEVKGWYDNLLDIHFLNSVYLAPAGQ
jgi:oligopeptide transport system substrate-binding protein